MTTLFLYGSISGLILGLTGSGGSIVAVPLLIYFAHLSIQDAIIISLFSVFTTGFFSSFYRWYKKEINWKAALIMIVGGIIGTPIGSELSTLFSPTLLMIFFGLLTLSIGIKMLINDHNSAHISDENASDTFSIKLLSVAGLITGVLTGLLGVGGGFLIIPALLLAANLDIRQAMGTSLVIVTVACFVSIAFRLHHIAFTDMRIAVLFALGSLSGMSVGMFIGHHIPTRGLKISLAVLLVVIGVFLIAKEVNIYIHLRW